VRESVNPIKERPLETRMPLSSPHSDPPPFQERRSGPRIGPILRQLVPGMVLPGLIYLLISPHTSVVVALCVASSIPVVDATVRFVTGKAPNPVSLVFVLAALVSIGLALVSGSPTFILAKGIVVSGVLGLAFAVSAALGRPLTRTLAIRLTAEHAEHRRRLARRWRHPRARDVFGVLSVGWGVLLLLQAGQQTALAVSVSPGTFVTLEAPIQGAVTALGIVLSVMYARRAHRLHPELGLLPQRVRS